MLDGSFILHFSNLYLIDIGFKEKSLRANSPSGLLFIVH